MSIYQMCYKGIQKNEQMQAENTMRDIEIHFQSMSDKKVPYREIAKYFIKKYVDAVNSNRAMYYRLQKLDPGLKVNSSFSSDLVMIQEDKEPPKTSGTSKMEARYEAMRSGEIKPAKRISDKDITLIKEMRARKVPVEDIADRFGVSVATVYRRLKE